MCLVVDVYGLVVVVVVWVGGFVVEYVVDNYWVVGVVFVEGDDYFLVDMWDGCVVLICVCLWL